ncbi:MAG: DinB family protein [Dehalococcoidia bacterium]|nr:MAG: DinB family protein [Dehalococcoidia bacterium]
MNRQEIVDILRGLPSQIEELVQGLSEDALRWRPSPSEWSIKEVCCHLRDSFEIDGERIHHMLSEDDPLLPAYDQEALAREREYQSESMPPVLTALRAFSGGLAYLLENLGEEEWQRRGRHEERGPISIAQYGKLLADHASEHLEQIRTLRGQVAPGQ